MRQFMLLLLSDRNSHYVHCRICLCTFLLGTLLLSGCGTSQKLEELQNYRSEMDGFCSSVSSLQAQIDAIEPDSENAQEELLSLLDQLAEVSAEAAEVSTPEGYEEAGEMCRRASDYLQEAKGEYHAAFEAEPFDTESFQKGLDSYQSAGRCLSLMLENLQQPQN